MVSTARAAIHSRMVLSFTPVSRAARATVTYLTPPTVMERSCMGGSSDPWCAPWLPVLSPIVSHLRRMSRLVAGNLGSLDIWPSRAAVVDIRSSVRYHLSMDTTHTTQGETMNPDTLTIKDLCMKADTPKQSDMKPNLLAEVKYDGHRIMMYRGEHGVRTFAR